MPTTKRFTPDYITTNKGSTYEEEILIGIREK